MKRMAATTHTFRCTTVTSPDEVWTALTSRESTSRFLYGIALESDWRAGSTITGRWEGGIVLSGEVLSAEPPWRLCYTLASGPDQPDVYVTWELRISSGGTVVRLSVDEFDTDDRTGEEAEDSWLPVLASLQQLVGGSSVRPIRHQP